MTRHIHKGIRSFKRVVTIVSESFDLSGEHVPLGQKMIVPPSPEQGIISAFSATGTYLRNAMSELEREQKEQLNLFVDGQAR